MAIAAAVGIDAPGVPPAGDQATACVIGSFSAVGPGSAFGFRGPMTLVAWAASTTSLATTANSLSTTVGSAGSISPGAAINSTKVPAGTVVGAINGTTVTLALPTYTYPINVSDMALNWLRGIPAGVSATLVGATVTGSGVQAGTTVLTSPVDGTVTLSLPLTTIPASTNYPVWFSFALGAAAIAGGTDAAAVFTGKEIVWTGTIQLERSFDGGLTWLVCNIGGSGALAVWSAGTPLSLTFGEPEKNVLYRLNCTAYTSGPIYYRLSQTGGANEALAIGPLLQG